VVHQQYKIRLLESPRAEIGVVCDECLFENENLCLLAEACSTGRLVEIEAQTVKS
jgi:hypothetical protein